MTQPQVVPRPKAKTVKKKPRTRKSIVAECDRLFGRIVRAPGRCCNCGSSDVIQCAHGFSRRYRAVRWDERNAFALCRAEHIYFTHRPLEWDEWLRARWGVELYGELRSLALRGAKVDLDGLLVSLRERAAIVESWGTG